MKSYLNSSLSLDDLLQDLKRNAGQVSLILTELESRGAQSSGEELLREYASISRFMKPRHVQRGEDLRVKGIRERWADEEYYPAFEVGQRDIAYLLSLLPIQPAHRHCNFCGKPESEVELIQATVGFICKNCVSICADIIKRDEAATNVQPVPIDFSCRVCGVQCDIAPDPPARAVCPEHCEDHDYEYQRSERGTYCNHCGQQAPEDWYDD